MAQVTARLLSPVEEDSKEEQHDPVSVPYVSQENGFVCGFCGKLYKRLGPLKNHLAKNHDSGSSLSYTCQKCDKDFDIKKKLTRHVYMKGDCSK